jgi:hypothetical protein
MLSSWTNITDPNPTNKDNRRRQFILRGWATAQWSGRPRNTKAIFLIPTSVDEIRSRLVRCFLTADGSANRATRFHADPSLSTICSAAAAAASLHPNPLTFVACYLPHPLRSRMMCLSRSSHLLSANKLQSSSYRFRRPVLCCYPLGLDKNSNCAPVNSVYR